MISSNLLKFLFKTKFINKNIESYPSRGPVCFGLDQSRSGLGLGPN